MYREKFIVAALDSPQVSKASTPQRLSFSSSVLGLPWTVVSQDCIEDCQELSGDGNDGDFFWLTVGDEPVAEGFERLIVLGGHRICHFSASGGLEVTRGV